MRYPGLPRYSTLLDNYPNKNRISTKQLLDSIGGECVGTWTTPSIHARRELAKRWTVVVSRYEGCRASISYQERSRLEKHIN
jgi:hypothetical protein